MDNKIQQLYEDACRNYTGSRSDYDAGVVEGLKRSILIIDRVIEDMKD